MNIPQVVIDTNVIVAGLRSKQGASYKLLSLVGTGRFEIHLSVPVAFEYEAVLNRKSNELQLLKADVEAFIDYQCSVAKRHRIFYLWRPILPDPNDDMILELAASAGCDFIITHNLRHYPGVEQFGVRAIDPGSFLQRLGVIS